MNIAWTLTGGDILQAATVFGGGMIFIGVMKSELTNLKENIKDIKERMTRVEDKFFNTGRRR